MSQTQTREERRDALDDFTKMAVPEASNVPAIINQAPITQVHGAQQLAVRRDEGRVLERLRVGAAAAGSEWFYRYPVKNRRKGTTDWIEGPSIKLANDLARIYGNCDVDVRVEDAGGHWIFYARFIDLESGFSLVRPFQQRKSAGTIGGSDDSRRDDMAFAMGVSKAERNVITNALQTFADFALDEARNSLVDKIGKDLESYRPRIKAFVEKAKIDIARAEAVIGRPLKEWLAPDIAQVYAMVTAINNGMSSAAESFPPLKEADGAVDAAVVDALEKFSQTPAADFPPDGSAAGVPAEASANNAEPAAAASAPTPREQTAAAQDIRLEAVRKLIAVALDQTIDETDRVGNIVGLQPIWEEKLQDPGFVKELVLTAIKVARGEVPDGAATAHLERLARKSSTRKE